jgi:hypothetical protein
MIGGRPSHVALLVAACIGIAGTARAQAADPSPADEGVELRRTGRDAEALAVFQRALAIDGSPRTRAQVALAEQALGFWVDAERDLSAALASGGAPWFVQHQSTLESALKAIRARLATLDVESNVPGAELWLNGSAVGELPLASPLRVVAGIVDVEVRAPGFELQKRRLSIAPGTQLREVVDLVKSHEDTGATTIDAVSMIPESRRPASDAGDEQVAGGTRAHTAAWALLGSSVALIAGASVALMVSDSNAAMYNDDGRCFFGGLTRDQRCGSYRDVTDTARVLAVVGFGTAVLAAGVSGVLFASGPQVSERRERALRCTFGIGIACGARF